MPPKYAFVGAQGSMKVSHTYQVYNIENKSESEYWEYQRTGDQNIAGIEKAQNTKGNKSMSSTEPRERRQKRSRNIETLFLAVHNML